ncbi:MAG TPA: type 4a pilus biogenesis protein PilO [Acidimicrobiales bacterium]|nr:type 4a pilus biogenesis protein PilO [Acidimicrobiales bacterium]
MRRPNPVVIGGAAAALVIILLLWWFALWSPRNKSYDAVKTQVQTAQSQLQSLQSQLSQLKAVNTTQLNNELAQLRSAIPDQPELDQIILAINTASIQSGVTLQTISPTPPAAATTSTGGAGAPPDIAVSITLTGGYFQIIDFVNRLNAMPRLLVVDTLNLSGGAGGTSGPELSVSMTTRLFVSQLTPTASTSGSGGGAGAATTTTTTAPSGSTATTTPSGGGATTTTAPSGGGAPTTTTAP